MGDSSISVEELELKYKSLTSKVQNIKEEKAGLEAQLGTLQGQYDELLGKLLNDTGASTLEEAIKICKDKQVELENLKTALNSELDGYLSTIDSGSEEQVNA